MFIYIYIYTYIFAYILNFLCTVDNIKMSVNDQYTIMM
jgi:hypothetical protein